MMMLLALSQNSFFMPKTWPLLSDKRKKYNLKNQIDWQINKPFDNA